MYMWAWFKFQYKWCTLIAGIPELMPSTFPVARRDRADLGGMSFLTQNVSICLRVLLVRGVRFTDKWKKAIL